MIKEIKLNDTAIPLVKYEETISDVLLTIKISFKVSSDDYHKIAGLLYEGTFNISIPEKDLKFKGTIQQYSTSITNLYENGQVGDYHVSFLEVKN